MKKIDELDSLKKIELQMLLEVDQFCRKHKLNYYLVGGTLLGAIRHKGFIPWDDDIDIAMYREDYNRLVAAWENDRFRVLKPGDCGYYYCHAKIVDSFTTVIENKYRNINGMGVFIDVFIIEKMGSTYDDAVDKYRILEKIRRKISAFCYQVKFNNISIDDIKILLKYWPVSNRKLKALQNKYQKKAVRNCKRGYVYLSGGAYGEKDIFPEDFFSKPQELEFEHNKFMAPSKYREYLKCLYGDFMKLPPKERRISNHDFTAYWSSNR